MTKYAKFKLNFKKNLRLFLLSPFLDGTPTHSWRNTVWETPV